MHANPFVTRPPAAGGQTPQDNADSGRTPRIIDRIPDQPLRTSSGYMPIPVNSATMGGGFKPVMDLSGNDLDAVTRTMLGEVGADATPTEMASVAATIRKSHGQGR